MNHLEELDLRYRGMRSLAITIGCCAALLAGLLLLTAQKDPERYIVYADDLGIARVVEPLEILRTPERRHVVAELRRAILNSRTISTDAALTERLWASAMPFYADDLRRRLANERHAEAMPARRDVKVVSILATDTEHRYLVRWRETVYAQSPNDTPVTEAWEGYVTIRIAESLDEPALLENPLGLIITHLTRSQVATSSEKE